MRHNSIAKTTNPTTLVGCLRTACATRLLLLLFTLPAVVQAEYTYTTNDGTITITGYTGPGGVVIIPGTINGLPVTSIGSSAFLNNSSLTNVTIPNSVTNIADFAFALCTSLTGVTLGTSVTNIGEHAFHSCTSLTSISIPNSVTTVGTAAFLSCTSLTNATIGSNVTSIGVGAFFYCISLPAITVDASNPAYSSVGGVLFNQNQTVLIEYPAGKTGSYTIPNSVTRIGDSAFYYCTALTSAKIPDSVTNIGYSAFGSCASLTNVPIPGSVSCIESYAFAGCASLTSVTIPSSVTNIGAGVFGSCLSLKAIAVDALNSFYGSVDGVLFNQSQTMLIQYPAAKAGSYTIPSSVSSIEDAAFSGCYGLTGVTIGNRVTSIGGFAFDDCRGLASVTIPDSVTSIGYRAFFYCVTLNSFTIPNSVTSIEDFAFSGCYRLKGVYFKGNAPNVGQYVFDGDNDAAVYYLPGTTGWGATFGGRPTVLWNPEIQTSSESFGVRTNQFGFTITGTSGLVIVVEACTNLANPFWPPVGTNTLTGGSSYFSDPEWTSYPSRFYRLRSP